MEDLQTLTIREKLINAIFDMVDDETIRVEEAKKYALMADEQLVDELINIAKYYSKIK